MDPLTAFQRIWAIEPNAERAARLLSYAAVIQLLGWESLPLKANAISDLRTAYDRAGIDPLLIRILADSDRRKADGGRVSVEEGEAIRRDCEADFATLAHNMGGHLYKKTEWRNRRMPDVDEDPEVLAENE